MSGVVEALEVYTVEVRLILEDGHWQAFFIDTRERGVIACRDYDRKPDWKTLRRMALAMISSTWVGKEKISRGQS